jgi:hypothetical protein
VDVVFDRKSEPKQRERFASISPQLQGIRAVYGILFPHERGEYSISRSLPCAPATFRSFAVMDEASKRAGREGDAS